MQHEHRRPLAMVRDKQFNVVRDQRHRHLKRHLSDVKSGFRFPNHRIRMAAK